MSDGLIAGWHPIALVWCTLAVALLRPVMVNWHS